MSSRTTAHVDGIEIPADVSDSSETHEHIRRWLWAVLLATGARALASTGRWSDARDRLAAHHGIGRRMFDGRQVAVIAHAVTGDTDHALAVLADTTPGEPWENAVTAVLTLHCATVSGHTDPTALLERYHGLGAPTAGLHVFRARLALSFTDALGAVDAPLTRGLASRVIEQATTGRDGYIARDVLRHAECRELLTLAQERELTDVVDRCALGCGHLPAELHHQLTDALNGVEEVITRGAPAPVSTSS